MKDVLEVETQASGQSESERMSINRINQTKTREPIRKQDKRNSREPSKIHCAINSSKSSMSENSANKQLNEKLLPANYFADKTIQRVIAIVKSYNKTAVSRLPSRGEKNSSRFPRTIEISYTWITGWLFPNQCGQ